MFNSCFELLQLLLQERHHVRMRRGIIIWFNEDTSLLARRSLRDALSYRTPRISNVPLCVRGLSEWESTLLVHLLEEGLVRLAGGWLTFNLSVTVRGRLLAEGGAGNLLSAGGGCVGTNYSSPPPSHYSSSSPPKCDYFSHQNRLSLLSLCHIRVFRYILYYIRGIRMKIAKLYT